MVYRTLSAVVFVMLGLNAFAGGHMHQSPLLRRNFRCPPMNPQNPRSQVAPVYQTTPDRADCAIRRIQRGW